MEVKKEYLILKCKVSRLLYVVSFNNPDNIEEGYCLTLFPFPKCFSIDMHNAISQDRKTNTTILTINRKIVGRINGPWTCLHGSQWDRAVINVTVFEDGNFIFKRIHYFFSRDKVQTILFRTGSIRIKNQICIKEKAENIYHYSIHELSIGNTLC